MEPLHQIITDRGGGNVLKKNDIAWLYIMFSCLAYVAILTKNGNKAE